MIIANIYTTMLISAGSLGLVALLALGAFGAPIQAAVHQPGTGARLAGFKNKLALQAASFSIIAVVCIFLGFAGSFALSLTKASMILQPDFIPFIAAAGGAVLLALLFLIPFRIMTAKGPGGFFTGFLGFAAGISSLTALGITLSLLRLAALYRRMQVTDMRQLFDIPAASIFPAFVLHILPACIGTAAALITLYLFLRRNKDDYGRDYYNFSLKKTGSTAFWFLLLQLPGQGFLVYKLWPRLSDVSLLRPDSTFMLASLLFMLLGLACFAAVKTTQHPLRMKPAAFFGVLFLLLGLGAEAAVLAALL